MLFSDKVDILDQTTTNYFHIILHYVKLLFDIILICYTNLQSKK